MSEIMLELVRQFGDTLPLPLVAYNEKGEIVYSNPAFQEMAGRNPEELIGKSIVDFVHPEDVEKLKDAMKRRLAGESVKPHVLRLENKEGVYKPYLILGGAVEYMGEKFVIVSLSDMTVFEEQKLMLLIVNRALRHDVLNALTAVKMYMEIVKEYCEDGEEATTILQKLEMSTERAIKIIKNLRDFEEAVVGSKLERINVREVVEAVAKHFDIPITVEGDCEVVADRGLRTVFENLFQNALQHGRTDRIEIKMKRVGDFCEIRVADYGISIPKEIKDRIFDKGFTYGEAASTGQGLYLVKKLVERYGGEIWVEDNNPKGSVFVIRLRAWDRKF